MQKWLKRVRGAIGMGLTWAVGWAAFGLLIGVSSLLFPGLPWWDPFFRVFDAPLPAMALPGFVGGMLFSLVLGVGGRRRRFHELSLGRVALWGAAGGALLSLVPVTMVGLGLATASGSATLGLWELTAVISVPLILLGAASASGSLLLARFAQDERSDPDDLPLGIERAQLGAANPFDMSPDATHYTRERRSTGE
jgi:hypothetical protein